MELLTLAEVADQLGVSYSWVWRQAGVLPAEWPKGSTGAPLVRTADLSKWRRCRDVERRRIRAAWASRTA